MTPSSESSRFPLRAVSSLLLRRPVAPLSPCSANTTYALHPFSTVRARALVLSFHPLALLCHLQYTFAASSTVLRAHAAIFVDLQAGRGEAKHENQTIGRNPWFRLLFAAFEVREKNHETRFIVREINILSEIYNC